MYVNARAIIEKTYKEETYVVIQKREKKDIEGESCYELPGGRLNDYESLFEALRREVKEETGLELINIQGEEQRIVEGKHNKKVECLPTYAAYQTIKGPVDSIGFYFKCSAAGKIQVTGDDTSDVQWININKLADWYYRSPEDFSWVDRAGIHFYLKAQGLDT